MKIYHQVSVLNLIQITEQFYQLGLEFSLKCY